MKKKHNSEIPDLWEAIRETGYGWILDLVQAVAFVVFIGGGCWLIYYLTVNGLQTALNQSATNP